MKKLTYLFLFLSLTAFSEEEEEGGSVGVDKGITEAKDELGFKLSNEAKKNFELKTLKLQGKMPWQVPVSAMLLTLEEKNVYRLRDGFYKRIDLSSFSKSTGLYRIASPDLVNGDEIVVSGISFLRMAEITAFGVEPEGHAH